MSIATVAEILPGAREGIEINVAREMFLQTLMAKISRFYGLRAGCRGE